MKQNALKNAWWWQFQDRLCSELAKQATLSVQLYRISFLNKPARIIHEHKVRGKKVDKKERCKKVGVVF